MPYAHAKCTNCGANLEVDNTKDAAVCPYCNTPYIVEKAIHNYNTMNNITADVVNIYGGNSADFVIRAGELIKYNGASCDVVIPDTVKYIHKEAFAECKGLRSVVIPDSVISITEEAFAGRSDLSNVTIPNSVMSIGDNAFEDCNSLASITIPNSVTSIGNSAFSGCSSLTSITIPNGVTSIGHSAFSGCSSLTSIIIPNSVMSIGDSAFGACHRLTSVTIPNSVTGIGAGAFCSCINLISIIIPNSVTNIGDSAFYHCPRLTIYCNRVIDWRTCAGPEEIRAYEERKQNSGCYIATAVYGSYDCPQVWTLRRYRDNKLSKTMLGRGFIRCYYALSPTIVKWFGKKKWFNRFWKGKLDYIVEHLNMQGYDNLPYVDK